MYTDELFIQRTCDLARLGGAKVSPNPMVGAVIVADNKIIGEGYHQAYGTPHAEVNAVKNVKPQNEHLLKKSKIYVSLEPCCIQGKTPPCTDLILDQEIPEVVISALDRSPDVNGKSIEILKAKGVGVRQKVLPQLGKQLSQPRTTFVTQFRPYIILKFAQSKDGFMASSDQK
ncbi:MAG: riboflavin biosynthesis protein RibD, partial [Bacteroidetes bacterium]